MIDFGRFSGSANFSLINYVHERVHEAAAMFVLWVDFFISVMSTKNFLHIQYKRLCIEPQWITVGDYSSLWMSFTLVYFRAY